MGSRYQESYRKSTGKVNLIFSILLVFVLNINLITIVQSLQTNPKALETLVDKAKTLELEHAPNDELSQDQKSEKQLADDPKQLLNQIDKLYPLWLVFKAF